MSWIKKFSIGIILILGQAAANAFPELYLKPGDRGEFTFTVLNASDSVNILPTPQVVYDNPPVWFNQGSISIIAYDSLKQGTSCQVIMDFSIAANALSSTADLNFKVVFSSPTVYPPVWYPAAGTKVIVDATPPVLSVIQPKWLDYSASTTVMPSAGIVKIVRGPGVNFYASDAESGIVDFQIYNSSGENLSAEYFTQGSGIGYSGQFSEDIYNVTTLNKSGASTSGKVYVDYTPAVMVSNFTTQEVSGGTYLDTFDFEAQSHWGLDTVKLLPATFNISDPLDTSSFDSAAAVREYLGNGASSATFTFQDVPDGEYVVYAKNSLGTLSVLPSSIKSTTILNPETGLYEHSVQYLNPDTSLYGDPGIILNFTEKEKLIFQITYDTISVKGLTFVNVLSAELPQEITNSYFTFPYGFAFKLKTTTVFSGNVSVRVDYRQSPFTQYQQTNAKLYAFIDGTGWVNMTSEAVPGWVEGVSTALSKMALLFLYPASQPYVAKSSILVNGEAEAELISYFSDSFLTVAATEQAPVSIYISSAETSGKYLVSDIFIFSGSNAELIPPGELKFRYSSGQLSHIGISAKTLSLSCVFENGLETITDVVVGSNSITTSLDAMPYICGLFSTTKPSAPDSVAPESIIQYQDFTYLDQDGKIYMGIDSAIGINSIDSAQNGLTASGVKAIYYNADVSSDAVAGAINGDFSPFIVYNSTFNLLEGSHTVTYFSVDNADNIELPKQTTVYIDYSSPETSIIQGDNQLMSNGVFYISSFTPIILTSDDPEYNGVASGVGKAMVLLDINREDCPPDTPYDFRQPLGTCANQVYNTSFIVGAGSHTLHYWAEDRVKNVENENLQIVFVDTTTPETSVYIDGVKLEDFFSVTLPIGSSITLSAIDVPIEGFASGVKLTGMLIDTTIDQCVSTPTFTGPQGTCDNPLYSGPFTLSTGTHTVYFKSIDNVGNEEEIKSIVVVVSPLDAEPPV
ncbi:MAG: hypothetical protein HY746_10815, partial [Elusimicrobia bacterium]|nr:hypothetical protein [Elusimicrobiota bacterium]